MDHSIATVAVLLVLAAAAPGSAQSTATLQGRVSDTSGSAFPEVTVRVLSTPTGFDAFNNPDGGATFAVTLRRSETSSSAAGARI